MERFKAMEKELKTKAYSAAGLNAASKMDPEEIRKEEIRRWISDQTDTLETQIDTLEAERETLLLGSKKSKKVRPFSISWFILSPFHFRSIHQNQRDWKR
jgi:CCR4-NOT transcription complex subunit 3